MLKWFKTIRYWNKNRKIYSSLLDSFDYFSQINEITDRPCWLGHFHNGTDKIKSGTLVMDEFHLMFVLEMVCDKCGLEFNINPLEINKVWESNGTIDDSFELLKLK